MKSFQKIARLSAVAAAAAVAAPAFAAASIDANAEFDTYVLKKSGSKSSGLQGTGPVSNRIEVNVAGRTEAGDMFLAGKGTVGITAAGGTYVDDAWVQLGTKTVDLKLGRFEAANLYPTGVDATRVFAFNTTGSGSFAVPASDGTALYQANALRGRARFVSDNTVDRFHGAVTANLGSGLSLEVGYVGKQAPTTAAPAVNGYSGARPVLTYASGDMSASVGLELGKYGNGTTDESFTGVGLTAAVPAGPAKLNFSVTSANFKNFSGSESLKSTALLATAEVGSLFVAAETGKNKLGSGSSKTTDIYGGYIIPLFGIKGASVIPALGYGQNKTTNQETVKSTLVAARVRYDF